MLLLDITTFEAEDSIELFQRWEEIENKGYSKGLKVVNQWFDAGGERVITLFDVENVKDYVTCNLSFVDLCHVDVFPVIQASEFKEFASKYMKIVNMKHSPKSAHHPQMELELEPIRIVL
jgi:hypothetical protein